MMGSSARSRPILSDVTLVAATSVALDATVAAMRKSVGQADFGQVLLLSDQRPSTIDSAIEWRRIDRLNSREDYSRFMIRGLCAHIATSHALCLQWDGFILDGRAWDPRFLDYDYIGAVWPQFGDDYNVGNGGFSLRSRRLLEACTKLPSAGCEAEDIAISRLYRPELERQGICFAPEAVARRFSYERTKSRGDEFGFHGAFNLVRHLSTDDAVGLFRNLEPDLLTRREHLEIFRWALKRKFPRLAAVVLNRMVSARL